MVSSINAIDKESVHRICSGQVVLDIATAVKELLENSIDAGATSIDIRFKDQGRTCIEVVDNGSGIEPSNYDSLALKHYTSKLSCFEDIESVMTFGFRGEALSSLCALSHFKVITATKEQTPMGVQLEYDSHGILTQQKPFSSKVGTTVTLSDIFYSLPVRQREFRNNIKREYNKCLNLIQAYSLILTNVKVSVYNQMGTGPSNLVSATKNNKQITDNINDIFGRKVVNQVMPFTVDLGSIVDDGLFTGYITKPEWGIGRSSADRQYCYVNGRPCLLPKFSKCVNEVYKSFIISQYPLLIADLKLPTNAYDVNVTPDKRTIFIHKERDILGLISEKLTELMEPSRSTFEENNTLADIFKREQTKATEETFKSSTTTTQPTQSLLEKRTSSSSTTQHTPSKRSKITINSFKMTDAPVNNLFRYNITRTTNNDNEEQIEEDEPMEQHRHIPEKQEEEEEEEEEEEVIMKEEEPNQDNDEMMNVKPIEYVEITTTITKEQQEEDNNTNMEIDEIKPMIATDDQVEYINPINGPWMTHGHSIEIANTFNYASLLLHDIEAAPHPVTSNDMQDANIQIQDQHTVERTLSRMIHKPDFARMQVIGQFNKGFMITNLDDTDLYIIDQHASDEKYNFETLQATTQMKSQRLFQPRSLDLTASEELVVMDHIEIFKQNGFEVKVSPENEPTQRVQLVSVAQSKNTMFDHNDFSELVFKIRERPGEMVHCSKTRDMFASRACHKAVRIGQALTKKQMKQIINHMGEIDQPWNCPHGRPTMRHLCSLAKVKTKPIERKLKLSGSLIQKV
ncbi:DNA mismatch repair protein MutL [Backusella circina FSU 941]|nr:DNA mismatch repair protein MutL [Backusella circina FSU 941]